MANPVGRPQEHDRIAIGKALLEWSKKPEALTIPMFATSIGLHSGKFREWASSCEEFRALFFAAKENVGINRLNAVTDPKLKLDSGIYRQTLHHYDLDIREDVRDDKRFDHELKRSETQQANENLISVLERARQLAQD